MSIEAPKCSLCGHRHRLGASHIWSTEEGETPAKVATKKPKLVKNVATINPKSVKNVATSNKKPINVATIRQVSIRDLNSGISAHFSNLPFEVTKRGKIIARVLKP